MGQRSEKLGFNLVLNFRRVTHFWLCLLKTQVPRQPTKMYCQQGHLCCPSVATAEDADNPHHPRRVLSRRKDL